MIDAGRQPEDMPRWQRLLLPSGMLEAPGGRRSARDWFVDLMMFVLAAGIGVLSLVDTWDDHGPALAVADVVLGIVALLALWRRRAHPVGVAAFTVALSGISALAGGAALAALFNAAIRAPRRALLWLTAAGVAISAGFPLLYPGTESYTLQFVLGLLLTTVVIGWGLFARAQRDLVRSLHERAVRTEAERLRHVDQAREAERRRIAREMHDVLAHRVSLLSLHAGALEFRRDASPEEIAEAAGVIRAAAHAALEELRAVIGVLRDDPAGDVPEPPQPTLAEIPGLVEESRAAGMRVACRIEVADGIELPAALGRTAYRVVQEGMTNARKHAAGAAVDVAVVAGADRRLVVEVVSRRPVGVAAGPPGARGAAAPATLPGAGTGLVGLTERVALAGGELEHGPGAGGDFVLRATMPWRA